MSTISTKQDCGYARTAQDIERKYSFGKTFAEMLGLINENRDKVDSVESGLRDEITQQSTTLKRDAERIVAEAKQEIEKEISTVDGKVSEVTSKLATLEITADGITADVERVEKSVEGVTTDVSFLKVKADEIEAEVKKVEETANSVTTRVADLEITAEGIKATAERAEESAEGAKTAVSNLEVKAEGIVLEAKKELSGSISEVDEKLSELSSQVSLKLDSNAVNIAIEKEMSKGVDKVVTKTGYRFDDDGLSISKSGNEMENLLDNTGMYVKKNGNDILVANNEGVEAVDLHAKTYLIIGEDKGRSRFEDYLTDRTACFWVGG